LCAVLSWLAEVRRGADGRRKRAEGCPGWWGKRLSTINRDRNTSLEVVFHWDATCDERLGIEKSTLVVHGLALDNFLVNSAIHDNNYLLSV